MASEHGFFACNMSCFFRSVIFWLCSVFLSVSWEAILQRRANIRGGRLHCPDGKRKAIFFMLVIALRTTPYFLFLCRALD